MTAPKRVLPADVYDALELSAYAYGGVGGGRFWDVGTEEVPFCIHGHAEFVGTREHGDEVVRALYAAGITIDANDVTVDQLAPKGGRISFRRWCRALNVVRGDP